MTPCMVVFLPPQALQWLVGTTSLQIGAPLPTSKDSVLDLAAKAIGADGSQVIGALLTYLRAAQPGTPFSPPAAEPPSPPEAGKP